MVNQRMEPYGEVRALMLPQDGGKPYPQTIDTKKKLSGGTDSSFESSTIQIQPVPLSLVTALYPTFSQDGPSNGTTRPGISVA